MTNLQQRTIIGLPGVFIIIGILYVSIWGYALLFGGLMVACLWEFYGILKDTGYKPMRWYGVLFSIFLFGIRFPGPGLGLNPDWLFLIFPALTLAFILKLYDKADDKPFVNVALTFLGILYVAMPFALFNLVFTHLCEKEYSFQIVLGVLLLLWASDTGAYFAGKNFGKTKLFERISPKKTWEGSLGGAIAAGLTCWLLITLFHDLPAWQWVCIAIIMVVVGTYGDLVESMFKRSLVIKDSGTALPGHGGFLDRFDGLLVSLPFIAAFLAIFS